MNSRANYLPQRPGAARGPLVIQANPTQIESRLRRPAARAALSLNVFGFFCCLCYKIGNIVKEKKGLSAFKKAILEA